MNPVSRREFLVASAATGGGLLLGWSWQTAGAQETASVFAPNAFIRIGTDGRVTLIMGQVEMGQGMYTAMPQLLAEELEVGLDQVRLEHAPPDEQRYANPVFHFQATGGSTSVSRCGGRARPRGRCSSPRRRSAGTWTPRRVMPSAAR